MVRAAPRQLSHPSAPAPVVDEPASGSCARREAINLSVESDTSIENPPSADPADEVVEAHPLQAGAPVRSDSPTFAELGVRPEIVQALAEAGIVRTFAIQELTLPLALAGDDLIGQARTGTGKTLGFGVPLIQRITTADDALDGTPRALVVVPTRELCLQVTADLMAAGRNLGIRVLSLYGGRPYE